MLRKRVSNRRASPGRLKLAEHLDRVFEGHRDAPFRRWSGGEKLSAARASGATRLTYSYVFTAAQAGTGNLTAPDSVCLCYGGSMTDAAGNRLQKHKLPAVT